VERVSDANTLVVGLPAPAGHGGSVTRPVAGFAAEARLLPSSPLR
jgi:hypothetical protein